MTGRMWVRTVDGDAVAVDQIVQYTPEEGAATGRTVLDELPIHTVAMATTSAGKVVAWIKGEKLWTSANGQRISSLRPGFLYTVAYLPGGAS